MKSKWMEPLPQRLYYTDLFTSECGYDGSQLQPVWKNSTLTFYMPLHHREVKAILKGTMMSESSSMQQQVQHTSPLSAAWTVSDLLQDES